MPKEEWGVKRVCPTTGKRFYDLKRVPIVSPYTGEVVVLEQPGRKMGFESAAATQKAKAAPQADLDADEGLIDADGVTSDDDDLLDEEDDQTVSLDDLADVADEDDEA